jgi:tetratricopeptide (TPR) repeat protein
MRMNVYKWQFSPRFRRHAYGWKSDTPIQRIKEAVTEIKLVARNDPSLGAEGAVLFLEKLSPAIEQVNSSSGAIGTAVNRAIDALVLIIAKPDVDLAIRHQWLERLWEAIQDDAIPYLETLGDYWGDLCVSKEMASQWADEFLSIIDIIWDSTASAHGYFKGTVACMSALYVAGRYDDLLILLDKAPFKWWHYRRWGVKALIAMNRRAEAIRYAEESRGLNQPDWQIAEACEAILLSSGLSDEAYSRYAVKANQKTTNLATFRAITKKYPNKAKQDILNDLITSTPESEGKWFAAAKDAGLFTIAVELIKHSPTDPRTLVRAARDFAETRPEFAFACGMAALHWIAFGYGYEITSGDVLDAYTVTSLAASGMGLDTRHFKVQIREITSGHQPNAQFINMALAHRLLD